MTPATVENRRLPRKLPNVTREASVWDTHTITVGCAGRSALSLVAALRTKMRASEAQKRNMDYDNPHRELHWDPAPKVLRAWQDNELLLDELFKLFGKTEPPPRTVRVSVDEGVLGLWEASRADHASHDVILECAASEQASCHGHLLSLASPVVKVMLDSEMTEGQHRRIPVHDCPQFAANLFLDLVYSGTTDDPPDATACVAALDLAYRWQVSGVVAMLERALTNLISDRDFEPIAIAAALKELPQLRRACLRFAAGSESVARKRARRELTPAVAEMLGDRPAAQTSTQARKRRQCF